MHPVIAKSFCGLTASYYLRQFLPGLFFFTLSCVDMYNLRQFDALHVLLNVSSQLLYPYSIFVYHRLMDKIFGDRQFFFFSTGFLSYAFLVLRFAPYCLCWLFAPVIAPIGLYWIYRINDAQSRDLTPAV